MDRTIMLPPPPFSPLSSTEPSPLSSPVSCSSTYSRSGSSRRSLSSRLTNAATSSSNRKSRVHSSAIFAIPLILAVVLVSLQLMNLNYGCPGYNEMSMLLLESQKSEFSGNSLRSRSLTVSGSSGSSVTAVAAVKEVRNDYDNKVLGLQDRISRLEHQVEQLRVRNGAADTAPLSQSPPTKYPSSVSATMEETILFDDEIYRKNRKLDLSTAALRQKYGYTSPACSLQIDDDASPVFNRIYFLHMRKAGGSSLRNYFEEVQKEHNITVDFAEGWKKPELPGTDPNTLYVTHVREPVARLISHYKYEHRWLWREQLKQDGFVPSENNTNMDFNTFITSDFQPFPKSKLYWQCSSECYAKWLTGYFPKTTLKHIKTNSSSGDTETSKIFEYDDGYNDDEYKHALDEKAREVLYNGYHLVIVNEWLKDPHYRHGLESLFGVRQVGRKMWMLCQVPTHQANLAVPLNVTDEEMEIVEANNRVDSSIYNDILKCGKNGDGGPQFKKRKPIRFMPAIGVTE